MGLPYYMWILSVKNFWLFQGSELFSFSCDFSDRRLADHFGGKLHLGYMQIREKLAELQVR